MSHGGMAVLVCGPTSKEPASDVKHSPYHDLFKFVLIALFLNSSQTHGLLADIGHLTGEEHIRSQPQCHAQPIAATQQQGRNQPKHPNSPLIAATPQQGRNQPKHPNSPPIAATQQQGRTQPKHLTSPPIAATPQQGLNQLKHPISPPQPHHNKQEGEFLRKGHPNSPPQPHYKQEGEFLHKEERRVQHNQQQHSLQGSDHPTRFNSLQNTRNHQFQQHQDHRRQKKAYHRCSTHGMLGMEEMRLDEMILQTFEEMENVFTFPLKSQREARAFTKELHNKGMTYKLIGSTVGESEHELAAWLGGQKNQQAGRMMIARINLPLVELLSSDEEAEIKAEKELTKQKAKRGAPITNNEAVHRLAGDKKQQQTTDLTSSWIKQIETKMATVEPEQDTDAWGDNDDIDGNSPVDSITEKRNKQNHKIESPSGEMQVSDLPVESVAFEVLKNAQRVGPRKEKTENEPETESLQKVHDASRNTEAKLDSPEIMSMVGVVEEPINKAVALENFACALNKTDIPTDISTVGNNSAASIVTDTVVPHVSAETSAPPLNLLLLDGNELPTMSGSNVWQPPAEESNTEPYQQEVNENYDSDLDIDNGDVSTQAMTIRKHIRTLKSMMDDSIGYLYVFSDNSGSKSSSHHRVKIGASRFPAKRLEQASSFNPDIQMVSAVSVNMRGSALLDLAKALHHYQLPNQTFWFNGPLPKILDIVAGVAAKFPLQSSTFA